MEHPRLYHLTARSPDAIAAATFCRFASGTEYLAVARGQWLDLQTFDEDDETLVLIARVNLFAIIRCIERVRIPGLNSDQLAVASDSGELVLLEYDEDQTQFVQFAAEKIAISGLRLEFPGEYLAVDPRGRVVMSAGLSGMRSALVLDEEGISDSPVEFFLSSTFCYAMAALDSGFENPAFACLEKFRFTEKKLSLYEFNLGLNHVVSRWTRSVDESCDVVIGIPGGREGPSGMMVFYNEHAAYWSADSGQELAKVAVGAAISCATLASFGPNGFAILAATVSGALIALQISQDPETKEFELSSKQVEVDEPVPLASIVASSITSPATGVGDRIFVFCNAVSGSHRLFQISPDLTLEVLTEVPNVSPVLSSRLQKSQLLITRGQTANTASIAALRLGLHIETLASSPLPAAPSAIFAAKRRASDESDSFIVIGFESGTTTALAIREDGAVGEVSEAETGIAADLQTIGVATLQGGFVQIHSKGLRYIETSNGTPKVTPWLVAGKSTVKACASTPTQVALALDDHRVVYFEERDGTLLESQQRLQLSSKSATALCFAALAKNEIRSSQLFVSLDDETLREYSVPKLKQAKIHALPYLASSLVHCNRSSGSSALTTNYLCVGHINGTMSIVQEDDIFTRVLGSAPVRLVPVTPNMLIALSSRAWIAQDQGATPILDTSGLRACHAFSADGMPNNTLIGVKSSTLEVFTFEADPSQTGTSVDFSDPLGSVATSAPVVKHPAKNRSYIMLRSRSIAFSRDATDLDTSIPPLEIACTPTANDKVPVSPKACVNVKFKSRGQDFLAVALGTKILIYEYASEAGDSNSNELTLLHETDVGGECLALLPFAGQLLAGVQNHLIIYEIGRKQLLRQKGLILKDFVSIRAIRASRDIVFVGDTRRSVIALHYHSDSGFRILAVDSVPRSVLSLMILDSETICIGDPHGNIAVLRIPLEDALRSTRTGSGSPTQFKLVCHFFVPDAIIGLHKGTLSPTASAESIVYVGLQGTVGALIPFVSVHEYDVLWQLERKLRQEFPLSLVNRDVMGFRSYYAPLRSVIDGDFLESLIASSRSNIEQLETEAIAEEMGMTVPAIIDHLRTVRYRGLTETMWCPNERPMD